MQWRKTFYDLRPAPPILRMLSLQMQSLLLLLLLQRRPTAQRQGVSGLLQPFYSKSPILPPPASHLQGQGIKLIEHPLASTLVHCHGDLKAHGVDSV
jgi:hypothetical protein